MPFFCLGYGFAAFEVPAVDTDLSHAARLRAGGRLLVASKNPKKLAEMLRILAALPIDLSSLADFPHVDEVEETGATFAENAALKAVAYARATGLPTVADDSGLEVDALGGAPGVFSARYGGEHGDDAANIAKLLAELDGVPAERRTARFRCCITVADDRGVLVTLDGACEGTLAREPIGQNGFGYDPVFIPTGADARTMAQRTASEKDAISHRGAAGRAFAAWLSDRFRNPEIGDTILSGTDTTRGRHAGCVGGNEYCVPD